MQMERRLKYHNAAAASRATASDLAGNFCWTRKLLGSRLQIQSMQEKMIGVVAGPLGLRDHVNDPGHGIDHRGAGDANLRIDVEIGTVRRVRVSSDNADVVAGYRRPQVDLPQRRYLD